MAHEKNNSALVKTLNSDDRTIKSKVDEKPNPKKVPEPVGSKQARAAGAALVKTLNSDDRSRHAKNKSFK